MAVRFLFNLSFHSLVPYSCFYLSSDLLYYHVIDSIYRFHQLLIQIHVLLPNDTGFIGWKQDGITLQLSKKKARVTQATTTKEDSSR